jgi:putative ABC transport system permease protein
VQTGVNGSLVEAAGMQLRDGLGSDAVITSADGVTPEQAAAVASLPGVDAVVASSTVAAEVKVDDDEDLGALSWEQVGIRALDGSPAGLIDVDVTDGSLDDLTGPATIAVSGDSLFGTGKGVGGTVDVRFGNAAATSATIVAVYDRGLGFGDYIVDAGSLPAATRPATADVLFAQGSADVAPLGLETVAVDDYVAETVAGAASEQQLSAILLFVLIFFVAIAAANTLVMTTGARRAEFTLLRRIGATRRQLTAMVATESLFVMVTALVIGTVSVVPALVGVSFGMLGSFSPAIDWPVYGSLSATVVLIAAAAMVLPVRRASRPA